jgi:hypothetical protein
MEKFAGTNPGTYNKNKVNMENTISPNSGTNPEINDYNNPQTEVKSRRLSVQERKRLGNAQTSLKQKNKKLERLNVEKSDLKKTLKRGFLIVKPKPPKEGEETVELKKTHVTLSSTDRLKIKDRIIDIDIELFELKEERKILSTKIVSKREQSIQAKKNILSGKKMAQKQKRNAASPGEEDLAAPVSTESETESKNTRSEHGPLDFMDERESVTVPLQNRETKVSVNSDTEAVSV